jgi:hypothetical protein
VRFSRTAIRAAVLDVASVLVFVVIGRASHNHGESVPGVASTAWPFLAGLGVGWLVARAWRRPMALVPSGLAAWLAAVAVGMVLRVVAGQGTAVSFIIVALCFLGLFLLGWRLLARIFSRPTPRRADDPSAAAAVHRGDRPAEGAGRGERLEHP